MERYEVSDPQAIPRAVEILKNGGLILYPTDTLYGLGADALSDAAVAKICAIKSQNESKPIHAIVADIEMAAEYAEVNDRARVFAENFLPGPLSLILKKKEDVDTGIARGIGTFGIRIPDNNFCIELARAFGRPITTTSANKSGQQPPLDVETILAQFGADAVMVDLIVDAGPMKENKPSTIVDVSSGMAVILREGAIPASKILAAIG